MVESLTTVNSLYLVRADYMLCVCVSRSIVSNCLKPMDCSQAPLFMTFPSQESWSG